MDETESVFELTERSFNSPASGIKAFEFRGRKSIGRQIGNDGFKGILREAETNDAERELIESKRIVFSAGGRKIVKGRR